MGIKFGEIDANQILENEFRIRVLEALVEWLLNRSGIMSKPSQEEVEEIKKSVITELKRKYPKSGIEYKGGE